MARAGVTIIFAILILAAAVLVGYLIYLLIKALRKYINSKPAREEKAKNAKTLGEVLKNHRTECMMTQEFVAEAIGVSRQAVSKWESGQSDPSTTNLIALAKLYSIAPEDLLKEVRQ
jgi:DNA-binding XRE family transcriptional regulator